MEEKLIELISNYQGIPKENITKDSHLIKDLELSSYDIVDLSCEIEDKFNVEIPDDKIKKLQTIGDVINVLHIQ